MQSRFRLTLFARVFSIIAIAIIALLIEDLGPIRFSISAFLLLFLVPFVLVLEAKFPPSLYPWAGPVPDLIAIVTLVHFVPQYWHIVFAAGLMVALAPSVNYSIRSHWIFASLGSMLLIGMSFAGWHHNVENWGLMVLVVAVIYPSLLYYAYAQGRAVQSMQKRAQALTSLNEIAGGVAHSFNNALMSVIGNLELAVRRYPADDTLRGYLADAIDGAERAGDISRQLVSFSGRGVDQEMGIQPAAELEILINLLHHTLPDGIGCSLVVDGDLPKLSCDRHQLQQLFTGLISLAAEPISAPGEVQVSCTASDGDLLVEVGDARVSSWNYRPVLMSVFPIRPSQHALLSCMESARLLEGKIQISYDAGVSRAFLLTLNGKQEAAETEPVVIPPQQPVEGGGQRVLIIDDDRNVRAVLSMLLTEIGCQVEVAGSGPEGLNKLGGRATFDRVFLDLKMPGMDGWECLQEIRRLSPDIAVTICSGYNPSEIQNMPDARLSYLQKPFNMDDLRDVM